MVAVLSCSPRTLQIIDGSCQHFWPEIRRFVREESIGRIFIWIYLVLSILKHYWMESWCIKLGIMLGILFVKLVFRESQVLFLCISVGAPLSICQGLCECCVETPHLSSVANADESAHWLESTGSTGQEVGAVVGLQEADKVGALCLQNTDAWTFIKALVLKEIQEKVHFIWLWLPEITSFMVWTGVLTY